MDKKMIRRKGMLFGIEDIKERLPHRYPFLLIDRIIDQKPGKSCTALKNVTYNEPFFMGHFPDISIMPGNMISEAIAQAATFIVPFGEKALEEFKDIDEFKHLKSIEYGFLTTMNFKILQPVIPGDQLIIYVKLVKVLKDLIKLKGEVTVDRTTVAKADFSLKVF